MTSIRARYMVRLLLTLGLISVLVSPTGAAAASPKPPTVIITGDILLAGRIGSFIEKKGPAAPFAHVRSIIASADLAIGNLECPLATIGRPADKEYAFRAHPAAAAALVDAGFDIMTLANNHSVDYGPEALLETLTTLRKAKLTTVGAGEDLARARRWVVVERGSPPVKIAVLAFSNMFPKEFYARKQRAGTNPAYLAFVKEDIAAARKRADVVIAIFHWGDELSDTPSWKQRVLAAAAAEAGADLVVGHHSHVLQGMEVRGRTLIIYSLGNFLFPSRRAATHQTVILRYHPNRNGQARVEIIPCEIKDFQPQPITGLRQRAACLTRLADLSESLGARVPDKDGVILLPARPASVDKPLHSP